MKALTALMVVGAIVLGAVLLVPMSLATNGTTPADDIASANGDCIMDRLQEKDQAKDGSCDLCSCDQDMIMQQNQTKTQDGDCDGYECSAGTCDPACDQVRERLQTQEGGMVGQMESCQRSHEQVNNEVQERSGTMSQSRTGKA